MATKVIDADGLVLGRMATAVAKRLLQGEEIHIVNAEKAVITGDPEATVRNWEFKRNVGTRRKGPFYPRMPDRMVKRTVRGMLPYREPRGRKAYRALRCYIGVPREHAGKPSEKPEGARFRHQCRYITIGDLAKELGASFGGNA